MGTLKNYNTSKYMYIATIYMQMDTILRQTELTNKIQLTRKELVYVKEFYFGFVLFFS